MDASVIPKMIGKKQSWMTIGSLNMAIVLGGHFIGWNAGSSAGFGSFLLTLGLLAFSYLSLVCCMAEMTSALPFSGGCFGVSRVTLGYYPGCLLGFLEIIQYLIYSSIFALSLEDMISSLLSLQKVFGRPNFNIAIFDDKI